MYDTVNRFFECLPILSDRIVDTVSKAEMVALQTSYNKSVYATSLGEYCREDPNRIIGLSVDYTPGQLCGTGRQTIKHYEETKKRLTICAKLTSERQSITAYGKITEEAYSKLHAQVLFSKLISAVAHQTDVRLQCMGVNEALKEFSLLKKKSDTMLKEVNSFCDLPFYRRDTEIVQANGMALQNSPNPAECKHNLNQTVPRGRGISAENKILANKQELAAGAFQNPNPAQVDIDYIRGKSPKWEVFFVLELRGVFLI